MTKTLAAVLVIVVAVGMAWGIARVSERNRASSTVNDTPVTIETANIKEQFKSEEKISLEILSPGDGETVKMANVTLSGKTSAGAEVQIENKDLKADESGEFSSKFSLDEGENEIVITANNEAGDYTEKTILVIYEPAN